MKKAFAGLSIALALGACGRPPAPVAACGPDCVAAETRVLPKNMPAYAQIYSGGWIDSTSAFANGGVVTYTAPAKIDDLARYYDGAASQGQLTRTLDTSTWSAPVSNNAPAPPRILIYAQAGTARNLYVNLNSLGPGYTSVALVYGAK